MLLGLAALFGAALAARTGSNDALMADAIVPLRSHSLYSPYVDSSLQSKQWDYGGDTIIDTNRYVRLTQDRKSERGWLWSRTPLEAENFEITVEFSIDGNSPTHHGDGFALWLTQERNEAGPVFGSRDYWHGFGIFFDTFANTPHKYVFPRIMIMENDGTKQYNIDRDGDGQELESCTMQLRRVPVETRLRLTYIRNMYLELAIQNHEWNQWSTCFLIRNATMPKNPFLGFSASTGEVTDAHDIVSVSTNSIVYSSTTSSYYIAERKRIFKEEEHKAKKPSWFGRLAGGSSDKSSSEFSSYKPKSKPKPAQYDSNEHPSMITSFFLGVAWLLRWLLTFAIIGAIVVFVLRYLRQNSLRSKRRMMA
ncbi:hypothetical protein MCUN1_001798 [Malassezia cuniculi]|uniref:L-type lectin-like domain-containing protein n=1 Tax=Malassezia cuniculi TaxID=948313 RepID=A0AAF0EUP4_9BASI|nr:hypothetical protein MCUN1_001798 [Malassezia cuniculi]